MPTWTSRVWEWEDPAPVGAVRTGLVNRSRPEPRAGSMDSTWLFSTDADTIVPPSWIRTGLRLAELGVGHLVVGLVDLLDVDPPLRAAHDQLVRAGIRADGPMITSTPPIWPCGWTSSTPSAAFRAFPTARNTLCWLRPRPRAIPSYVRSTGAFGPRVGPTVGRGTASATCSADWPGRRSNRWAARPSRRSTRRSGPSRRQSDRRRGRNRSRRSAVQSTARRSRSSSP